MLVLSEGHLCFHVARGKIEPLGIIAVEPCTYFEIQEFFSPLKEILL